MLLHDKHICMQEKACRDHLPKVHDWHTNACIGTGHDADPVRGSHSEAIASSELPRIVLDSRQDMAAQ